MDLTDILQWISGGRKSGTLHLERRSVKKRISFRRGVIVTSWSSDPRECLGQFLVRDRLVTEEQLFEALLRQEREGRRLGAILVGDGALSEHTLQKTLRLKVAEAIYDLFLWPEGRFEFEDGDVPPDSELGADLEVQGVIMEGIRRIDEWQRIRQAFPTVGTTFRRSGDATADVPDTAERQLLAAVRPRWTIRHLALELRRSEFEVAELAFALFERGLLEIDAVEAEPSAEEAVGLIHERLARADRRLAEKRYGEALAAYEEVLALDRLNQRAKKGLVATIEARSRERALRLVPRDRIPVLRMDFEALTKENFDPQEGFVISRVNGLWDVQSILKLCPLAEDEAMLIFARLLERRVIVLK